MSARTPRPDLRDRKAAAIVEAAAQVFAERGFQAARVADVAERAGVGKGTLYEYFRSKDEIFLAVFDAFGAGSLEQTLAEIEPRPESAAELLRVFAATTLEAFSEALYLYPLTMEFWSAAATSELKDRLMGEFRDVYSAYRGVLADAIREGIAHGEFGAHVDPEHTAAGLVGAIDALFLQAWIDPAFDPVASGADFVEIVLRGMAAESHPVAPISG